MMNSSGGGNVRRVRIPLAVILVSLACSNAVAEESPDPFFVPRPTFEGSRAVPAVLSGKKDPRPNLLRQIGTDFKNVFTTKENLVIVGAGLAAAWGASHFDEDIALSGLNSELHQGTAVDGFFEPAEILGGGLVQVGGALATYGFGRMFSRPGAESLGRELLRAQVVTQSLTLGVKFAARRERPDGSNKRSFPSGHASGTFATATVLQRRYGWKVGVPAYVVAGYARG